MVVCHACACNNNNANSIDDDRVVNIGWRRKLFSSLYFSVSCLKLIAAQYLETLTFSFFSAAGKQ